LPVLGFHELFEGKATYVEVPAYVRDLGRIQLKLLHSDNRAALHSRLGDNKRVGILTASQKLLLLDVLLKVATL
jgi:hypothetical protein